MEAKPKSIRAIRKLRKSQPKLIEGPKKTMLIRGNKSSNEVMSFLKDIVYILLSIEILKERQSCVLFS